MRLKIPLKYGFKNYKRTLKVYNSYLIEGFHSQEKTLV